MRIEELDLTRVAELRAAIRMSNKKAREVHKFLVDVRIDAELSWDPECPTPRRFYDRIDSLLGMAKEAMLAEYIYNTILKEENNG